MATTLTRSEFTARVTAFIGKREISRLNAGSPSSSYRLERVLDDVSRYARYNEQDGIPAEYGNTAYGIAWAVQTGRINGLTHMALKAMSVRELFILIHKAHTTCANMGEIPAYLMGLTLQSAN